MTFRPHTEDDDEPEPTYLGAGSAHHVADRQEDPPARAIARLFIPDPEQASGWREHYIRPALQTRRAQRRPIGFGKPR